MFTYQGYGGCSCSSCKCSSFWSGNGPDISFPNGQVIVPLLAFRLLATVDLVIKLFTFGTTSLNSVQFIGIVGAFCCTFPVPLGVRNIVLGFGLD